MARLEIDGGRSIDWGSTSEDYARFRKGYPVEFYNKLRAHGIGTEGQSILDLGTGTGEIALSLAPFVGSVIGVDAADNQIAAAGERMKAAGVENVEFVHTPVEEIDFPNDTFDVVTASLCWRYFDHSILLPKLASVLRPEGSLLLSWLVWLPEEDSVAKGSEQLALKYNPGWQGAGFSRWNAHPADVPADSGFRLKTFDSFATSIAYDVVSWMGRFRACRGVGAALTPSKIAEFDDEHRRLLLENTDGAFEVKHMIWYSIFENTK